jgi:transcriptional regulator with XRE-family HTH domain
MNIREIFAANLKALRTRRKVSQEELAHRAGLDRTYISSLERCIYSPTIDVVQQIADVLQTSAAELVKDPNSHQGDR